MVFLLGLPSGVLSGLMKLLMLFMVGVTGRGTASPASGALSLLLLLVLILVLPGKKLDMKLAIFFFLSPAARRDVAAVESGLATRGEKSDRAG
jgi:hypothetical protein